MGRMQWIVGGVILAVGIPLLAQAPAPQPAMKVMVRPITGPVKTPPKAVPNPVPLYVKVDPASLTVDQQKAILKVHAETKAALNKLLADEHSKVVALLNAKQKAALDQQDLKDNLDSMSEMGEMESLRLQMAMDRISKFIDALSAILKKNSDAESNLIPNMK